MKHGEFESRVEVSVSQKAPDLCQGLKPRAENLLFTETGVYSRASPQKTLPAKAGREFLIALTGAVVLSSGSVMPRPFHPWAPMASRMTAKGEGFPGPPGVRGTQPPPIKGSIADNGFIRN